MNRRAFVLGCGGALSAGVVAASQQSCRPLALGTYPLTNTEQFSSAQRLAKGAHLVLRRRPDRSFDARSIEVLTSDFDAIGYLPPAFSSMLAAAMDGGCSAFAIISDQEQCRLPISIDVYVDMPMRV
jgi:hypothetical protein